MIASTIATALWAMGPAYVPNNAAVLAGGGEPIDGGREWRGRRLLGDGKTWRGSAVGTLAGVVLALVCNVAVGPVSGVLGVSLPTFPIPVALALAAGAMAGDVGASFLKRRVGRERGAAVPGLDQLDFVGGALVVVFVVAPGWASEVFTPLVIVAVVVVTPVLHLGTNGIAYTAGLKAEPW